MFASSTNNLPILEYSHHNEVRSSNPPGIRAGLYTISNIKSIF